MFGSKVWAVWKTPLRVVPYVTNAMKIVEKKSEMKLVLIERKFRNTGVAVA